MGRIVHVPQPKHRCPVLDPIGPYSHAPVGSIYECDCGRSFVARENPARNVLGRRWVPESRRSRRHRRRAAERRKFLDRALRDEEKAP